MVKARVHLLQEHTVYRTASVLVDVPTSPEDTSFDDVKALALAQPDALVWEEISQAKDTFVEDIDWNPERCGCCAGEDHAGPCCPGFIHMDEPHEIQRCDDCNVFHTDEEAVLAHRVLCGCEHPEIAAHGSRHEQQPPHHT